MPRKTRKEKQAATLHKKMKYLKDAHQRYTITVPEDISHFKQPVSQSSSPRTEDHISTGLSFFFADLNKSILFVVAIVALEISIYFASINHYLSGISLFR